MAKKMLIDAAHPEETRVAVSDGNRLEEFDYESDAKRQLRGNIYLAKVTRVEPSLQAAFVEYGGNRHGFLAFNEIHPDYYQIPYEDRQKLIAEEAEDADDEPDEAMAGADDADAEDDDEEIVEEQLERRRKRAMRRYKIQEVIKRRQIMLVQVVKEERGNKGAALTTYLSLAGRYCVLMPNTSRGGGISRKIASATDRKRLKGIISELKVPNGMGLIIRTAGAKRTKAEIKRDYDYLLRLWEKIREQTLKSTAPVLVHEEGNLVKRSIRDLYDKDIEDVLVEGDEAYKQAKDFMRVLMPSHAKKVQPYRDKIPLFQRHQMETQIDQIYNPVVQLKSGGYLVINTTEALVAIDVNSGRATKERNIESTAVKTNLEAAEEACRQMRMRDLAGLLVIDFIDMEENKNNRAVEKRMKDSLKADRARVQVGRISQFGLLEMSRQRRRASLLEGSTRTCPTCSGLGFTRSIRSAALHALRQLEEEAVRERSRKVRLTAPTEVAMYLLNEKRSQIQSLEDRFGMIVSVEIDPALTPPEMNIEQLEELTAKDRAEVEQAREEIKDVIKDDAEDAAAEMDDAAAEADEETAEESAEESEDSKPAEDDKPRRRRGRRGGRGGSSGQGDSQKQADQSAEDSDEDESDKSEAKSDDSDGDEKSDKPRRRRRRGRRGGRGRRNNAGSDQNQSGGDNAGDSDNDAGQSSDQAAASGDKGSNEDGGDQGQPGDDAPKADDKPKRSRRSRGRKPQGEDAKPSGLEIVQPIAGEDAVSPEELGKSGGKAPVAASGEAEVIDFPEPETEKPAEKAEKPKPRTRRKPAPKADEAKADAPKAKDAPKAPAKDTAEKPKAEKKPKEAVKETVSESAEEDKPRRRGWWQRG